MSLDRIRTTFSVYKDQALDNLKVAIANSIPKIILPGAKVQIAGSIAYDNTSREIYYSNGIEWLPIAGNHVTAQNLSTVTGIVNVSAAAAPSANQVLTATNSTHATWQSPATVIGLGAAEFIQTTLGTNNSVVASNTTFFAFGSAAVFNVIPGLTVQFTPQSPVTQGTVFTLNETGIYSVDFEMSIGTAASIGVYKGTTLSGLTLDGNSITGALSASTWMHGRVCYMVTSPLIFAIGSIGSTANVTQSGNATGYYVVRCTVVKIA